MSGKNRKFYTIMIVPHAAENYRRVRVSKNLVVAAGVFLGALLLAGVLLPHFVLRTTYLSWVTSRLATQNAELKKSTEEIDAALGDLRRKMNDFETRATEMGSALGVAKLPLTRQAAAGGGPDLRSLSPLDGARFVQGELKVLKQRSENLQDSLQILDAAYEKQAAYLASTPSIIPVRGLYGNGFGWRKDPFTGERDFHQGLDIAAAPGTRVVAPADGIVTMSGPSGGYGNFVVIAHGYGFVTHYGHLMDFTVHPGQQVHRGDIIGHVGSTGRSTGPHLHYEVVVHQRTVDPTRYILDDFRTF
jgi:murein DD-endopeptidase MepM/ murein hydrolase activator NlpD